MMGEKYFVLLAVLFLNLFTILKLGLKINFLAELFIFVLFLIISMIILISVYREKSCGLFTSVFFIMFLINLFYIKNAFAANAHVNAGFIGWLLFGITLFVNAIAFLVTVSFIGNEKNEKEEDIVEDLIEPAAPEVVDIKETEKPKTEIIDITPGKFVASSNSSFYHIPTCDWAKKISKKNKVWLKDKKEAKKKKYKQHSCLKKK